MIGRYVRSRLHRKIFVWFGATIFFTCLVIGLVTMALGSPWKREYEGMRTLLDDRFAQVWDDPAARRELADAIATHLGASLVLLDAQGEPLPGEEGAASSCRRMARPVTVPVTRGQTTVGAVKLCSLRSSAEGPLRGVLALFIAGVMVWAASGKIARRLARPHAELARVAHEIGAGNLKSRMQINRRESREVLALAHAVNDMAARIERQLADQRELLAAVSHEIRTPLARIRIVAELSRSGGATPKMLDELDREVMEIDALVGELLASSRLDFAALTLRRLDAIEIGRRGLERGGAPEDCLQVAGGAEELPFRGDATLVARALANLLQNAHKHGLGVRTLRVGARDDRVYFEVEDQGPGFGDGEETRVFDSFYRSDNGSGPGDDGPAPARQADISLGLGLTLVRRIAEAHGGRAWAENLPGGGARVGIELARDGVAARRT
ncbi:MAG: HAMP domain-containing sensor histidine kinase [Polyangiaceae bacterium]